MSSFAFSDAVNSLADYNDLNALLSTPVFQFQNSQNKHFSLQDQNNHDSLCTKQGSNEIQTKKSNSVSQIATNKSYTLKNSLENIISNSFKRLDLTDSTNTKQAHANDFFNIKNRIDDSKIFEENHRLFQNGFFSADQQAAKEQFILSTSDQENQYQANSPACKNNNMLVKPRAKNFSEDFSSSQMSSDFYPLSSNNFTTKNIEIWDVKNALLVHNTLNRIYSDDELEFIL